MKLLDEFYQTGALSPDTLAEIEELTPEAYAELCGLLRVTPPSADLLDAPRCQHILYQLEFVFDDNHGLLVEDEHCRALKADQVCDDTQPVDLDWVCGCPV